MSALVYLDSYNLAWQVRGVDGDDNVGPSPLLAAAHWYAETYQWAVLPVHGVVAGRCGCGKVRCRRPGKHPKAEHGYKSASRDPGQIEEWWAKSPIYNVGIATGAVSGIFVLDIDPGHDGDKTLAALEREHGRLPDTVRVETGGGGRHFYFRHPGRHVWTRDGWPGPGLDIRGDRGYAIAPPSIHLTGNTYEWENARAPEQIDPAVAPDWLVQLVTASRPRTSADGRPSARRLLPPFDWQAVLNDGVPEGRRNWSIFRMACSLHGRGTPQNVVEELALIAAARCRPPLPEEEALVAVQSSLRYLTNEDRRRSEELSDERTDILHALYLSGEPMWQEAIARVVGNSRDNVKSLIVSMRNDGQVYRTPTGYRPCFGMFLKTYGQSL